mgnify:CR=1 FL=1
MTYEHLDVRIEDQVAWATMNRPDRLNALNPRLVEELRDFFTGLYWRRDVRVVVLRGAGRAFCAGLDLKERSGDNADRSVGAGLTGQRRISEIVIAIQAQSGGNLSEALGNLSGVLRDRKRLENKVQAMSSVNSPASRSMSAVSIARK